MPFHHLLRLTIPLVVLALATLAARTGSAESWTSLHGSTTIEAKMIGMWADSIVLEMEDGRRVTVSLSNLRADSRIQARELARTQTESRSTLVKELKAQAEEAAAPAPTPIPKPRKAPAYVQPKENASVIDHLRLLDDQTRSGHIVAVFDALPPSYRKDVSEIAKLGAKKINVDSWESLMGSIHSIGDVLVTRQRWVFSHPRMETMTPATLEPIQDIVLLFAGLIRDGLDPQAMDLKRFQSMSLRDWIMERDQAMAPYIAALDQYNNSRIKYELVSEQDGVSTVKQTVGENSDTVELTKVEGFWVPKEWADHWAEKVTQARQKLDETPDGSMMTDPMITMLPGMIQPVIAPMLDASDEKGFHAAMESLFAQAAPMATLAGVDLSGGRGRRNDSGYSEDYEDMDSEMDSSYEEQMRSRSSSGRPPGTGGSSDANPNIGARFEDEMRRRRSSP